MYIIEIGQNHLGSIKRLNLLVNSLIRKKEVEAITFQIREKEFYKENNFKIPNNYIYKLIKKIKNKKKKVGIIGVDLDDIEYFSKIPVDFFKVLNINFKNKNIINFLLKKTRQKIYLSTTVEDLKFLKENYLKLNKFKERVSIIITKFSKTQILNVESFKNLKFKNKVNLNFGFHQNSFQEFFQVAKLGVKDIFFYVKTNEKKINFLDNDHAISINDVNNFINKMRSFKNKINVKTKLRPINNVRFSGNEIKYLTNVISLGFKASKDATYASKLEKSFAKLHKKRFGIAFNSCTSALHASLLAIGCEKDDEVLVPALTPLMCGLSINYTGATPVYVDSDPDTFLLCEKDLQKKITKKTKAIMAVHMYGGVCDLKKLKKIANKYKLYLIEDVAEATAAIDNNNNMTGTVGDISCWSFQAAKQLSCGDGGIAVTNNPKIALKLRKIGNLGFRVLRAESGAMRILKDVYQNPDWDRFDLIGYNYRMNELGAAVAFAQFERMKFLLNLRRKMALNYLKAMERTKLFKPQKISKKAFSTYYTFSALFLGEKYNLKWRDFRAEYIKNGGDGIYGASKLLYQEPAFRAKKIGRCFKGCSSNCVLKCKGTPVAKILQQNIMNFTTNQSSDREITNQTIALQKTLKYFGH